MNTTTLLARLFPENLDQTEGEPDRGPAGRPEHHPGLMRGSFTPQLPGTYVFELTVQNNSAPAAGGIAVIDSVVTLSNSDVLNNVGTSALSAGVYDAYAL